ncbi:hypothetical protein BO78DRAFT_397524 [Aspergillus sclerotiicarbonarius CBS 121057]|uniref:WW domain-containing protein n=1 Tax=Aspergillus sclerotiicarbonarius (strain CBS 121057 / IBT 28362) TaxID=1448318 RepID=A0A319FGQ6_ASPSB|nr:hypothetical protein BO78DRAFT_397524 [Aspergillus sclerotiicarbonarius CBS 121057]
MSATPPPDTSPAAGAPPKDGDQTEARFEAVEGDQEEQTGKDHEVSEQEEEKAQEQGEEEAGLEQNEEEEGEEDEDEEEEGEEEDSAPPLPDEIPPPLPNEPTPRAQTAAAAAAGGGGGGEDDGWEPVWDGNAQAYYFYNRYTGTSQWKNPRVPDTTTTTNTADDNNAVTEEPDTADIPPPAATVGGYNPAIHGDYDPTAPYAQQYEQPAPEAGAGAGAAGGYEAVGAFNRFTGRWQAAEQNAEYHNDENKSRRQMYAFFDVDAAANSHDGRSLRAERSAKKLSKKELKMFKEKRREKKEEKRRAWLRD